jgi:S1-C subfamily serine protease
MPLYKDLHEHHRKHRNVLYSLVIVLALLQIISFTVFSIQSSKLNAKLDASIQELAESIEDAIFAQQQFTTQLVETYDALYQDNFQEISNLLSEQQKDFKQQIRVLQSSQEDFSGIVQDAVKGVVSISTGSSIGTGFIVHPDGYLVTNYHVINSNPNNVRVLTYDRDVLQARLIGKDENKDLALLKIEGSFYALSLGDSNELQVGRKVIAIGNPLGLSFTVTEGIVSGLDRVGPNGLAEYVQTDVSLNPGNSGGPLIDVTGEVVGINNFKIGGAESLGFALESDSIKLGINAIANQTIID